jgi:cysteine desulfuration protein SufE
VSGTLAPTFQRFQAADRQTRLDLLLDYAKRLPELPEHLREARDRGLNMVPECQSPVFLWVDVENGKVRLHADAPREAPTVRGFVALLEKAVRDASPAEVEAIPGDLLYHLGLADALGMTRLHGLTAILQRLKREAALKSRPKG